MPEIAATQTAADMTYAKPHAFMPTGGSNRRAARVQAAALRWLVRMAALLTAADSTAAAQVSGTITMVKEDGRWKAAAITLNL